MLYSEELVFVIQKFILLHKTPQVYSYCVSTVSHQNIAIVLKVSVLIFFFNVKTGYLEICIEKF